MTALCGGGDSRIKPGLAEVVILGSGALASLLNNRGRFWALVVAPLVGVVSYDALNLCQDDPPAEPTITADDALAILNINDLAAFAAAIDKFRQLIIRAAWFEFCECVAPPQPSLAPLPQPPNWPDLSPLYAPGPAAPCFHSDSGEHSIGEAIPTGNLWFTNAAIINGWHTIPVPSGATHVRIAASVGRGTVETSACRVSWFVGNAGMTATGTPNDTRLMHPTASIPTSVTTFDAGAVALVAPAVNLTCYAFLTPTQHGENYPIQCTIEFFCGGAPGAGLAPCGPDPLTIGLLQQLVQLTTLIQRQAVPFAYIHGAVHNGLSGEGEIAVQGLIGMLVEITTFPSGGLGEETGNPDVLFGAGWFNWGNADGFTDRERLSALSQLSLPPAAGQFTRFAYSLPPGLEVRLTELVREA